jgi:hypothetical protein
MFGLGEIWGLLAIPLVFTVYLLVFHRKATVWWELAILWAATIAAIPLCQMFAESYAISDHERWGYNTVSASYDQPFQYWDECSRSYACGETCSGSGKNRTCSTKWCTEYYPCKQWGGDNAWLTNQRGGKMRVSKSKYNQLAKQFGNEEIIELNRHKSYDIIVDGERQHTKWPGTWQTAQPIVEGHTYDNKSQASTTIKFRKVTDKIKAQYGLFDFPELWGWEERTVLDKSGKNWQADKYFRYLNGILGPKKRLRLWVLIFRDQPRDAALWQKDYWKNGNKNEFIICIGADKAGKVMWGEIISWTEQEALKIEMRDYVENMGTVDEKTMLALAQHTEKKVGKEYIKPSFDKKFAHLSVNPPTWIMVTVAIFIFLVNAGVALFVVKNNYKVGPTMRRSPQHSRPMSSVSRTKVKARRRTKRRR